MGEMRDIGCTNDRKKYHKGGMISVANRIKKG